MGFYERRILPPLLDSACSRPEFDDWRPRATEGLSGTVIELGFGSGLNLRHYPSDVERILAVEPSMESRARAAERIAASPIPVEFVGLEGESIPLEDASADFVLSTYTLCTIPDLAAALGEVARVLRPGGALHVLEHGRSPKPGVARWQRRLTPIQRRIAGGCHLDRDIDALLVEHGFAIAHLDEAVGLRPELLGYFTVARATPIAAPSNL